MNLCCIVIAFLCFSCITIGLSAQAAEILSKVHPYISLKEDYSDNLDLTSTNKKEDFFTTVQPGIKLSEMDDTAGVDLDYSLGAVFYSEHTNLNYISHNASLNAQYLTSQHINVYLKESFIRSDEPLEHEYFTTSEDNKYVLSTRTERAIYWRNVVSPMVEYRFGPETSLGVSYRNNLYQTESVDSQDSQEHYINPFFSCWFDNRNGITLGYGFTRGDFEKDPDLTGHQVHGSYTHRFSAASSVFVDCTYSRHTFESPGEDYDIYEPAIGISYAVTPTLNVTAQGGYFWRKPDNGPTKDGFSYKGELKRTDPRTTFQISFQGGYTENFFTSENLGFSLYHRLIGSLTYELDKQISVGSFARIERSEFDGPEHRDTTWEVGARSSYMPLRWLTLALEFSHRDRQSDVSSYEYEENRGMVRITAVYY